MEGGIMSDLDYGKYARLQETTISTKYKWWLPGVQLAGSGAVVDQSGNAANAALGADAVDGTVWGNAGYFTTIESGNEQSVIIPEAKFDWNMANGESLLISFRVLDPDLASGLDGIVGNWNVGGKSGVRFMFNSTGSGIACALSDEVNTTVTAYSGPLADAAEHHVCALIDGSLKTIDVWVDNVLRVDGHDASSVTGATNVDSNDFYIGSDSNAADTVGGKFRDFHCLTWIGGIPTNITEIVSLLNSRIYWPLSDTDFEGL